MTVLLIKHENVPDLEALKSDLMTADRRNTSTGMTSRAGACDPSSSAVVRP